MGSYANRGGRGRLKTDNRRKKPTTNLGSMGYQLSKGFVEYLKKPAIAGSVVVAYLIVGIIGYSQLEPTWSVGESKTLLWSHPLSLMSSAAIDDIESHWNGGG